MTSVPPNDRYATIPDDLRALPQWVTYRTRPRKSNPEKLDKIPVNPKTGGDAKTNDSTTWGTFEEAVAWTETSGLAGIGFVFTGEDSYVGTDLDDCINPTTGEIEPESAERIKALDTYTERSPSGTGVHCISRGKLPPGGRKKGHVEMYDCGRFFTMTGRHLAGTPTGIENRQEAVVTLHREVFGHVETVQFQPPPVSLTDDEVLAKARSAKNAPKFESLWSGNAGAYSSQSEADLALCSMLAFYTGPDESAVDRLFRSSGLMREKWDAMRGTQSYGQRTIAEALNGKTEFCKQSAAKNGISEKPEIRIEGGKLPECTSETERAIIESGGDPIFQRESLLVRIARTQSKEYRRGTWHEARTPLILPVDREYLADRATQAATFLKWNPGKEEFFKVDCPARIASTLLARTGEWRLPYLAGIIEAPTLRPDGSLLMTPGYDERSGLYLAATGISFPTIPMTPSAHQVNDARALLLDLISGFPFVDECDRSAALALQFTSLVRRAIPNAPMTCVRAPKMGSGKSLLVDTTSMIATGRPAAVMSQGKDEDEDAKRIFALLLEGACMVSIDNVERPLGGAALSSVLTQRVFKGRILGLSKMATVPTSTTWAATGNNLVIAGDLSSRVIPSDLEAAVERPEERKFDRNLYEYIPEHRGELVAACLTIMLGYIAAGKPDQGLTTFGRFEEWSDLVRSAIVWCDMADPCEGRRRLEDSDPVREDLCTILTAWEERIEGGVVPAHEALTKLSTHKEAGAVIQSLFRARGKSDKPDSRSFGQWLKKHCRRVENGLRIEKVGNRSGSALWRVIRV